MEADFSGWATKANLRCSDGRTIKPEAFQEMDGQTVPLVWQHVHGEVTNVLGHAVLEARPEGIYAHGYFNDTTPGEHAKKLVHNKDIKSLSIYANNLVEKNKAVLHGVIRELSLVLSGANPGAVIENVRLAHSANRDEDEVLEDEAIIEVGMDNAEIREVEPASEKVEETAETKVEETKDEVESSEGTTAPESDGEGASVAHAATGSDDETLEDVYNSLSEKQKTLLHYMVGTAAAGTDVKHSDSDTDEDEDNLTHQEGTSDMSRNAFEGDATKTDGPTISHSDVQSIFADAHKNGSLKDAFIAHAETAATYGIEDIDFLFPDAKSVTSQPDLIARRTEWVKSVIDGAKHSPFSRVKSLAADLTADEARAKGYVKGNLKKDEVIKLLRRVTTPTTVYKKQKLDRDDMLDITELDVVAWLKWEMRFMLEEELARAILIGDGREPDDEDKIDEEKLRPIAWDNEMYTHSVTIPGNSKPAAIVESVIRARKHYKGTGNPTLYTTDDVLTDMLLIKDLQERDIYANVTELAAKMRVKEIVVVEVMESTPDLAAILVNMADYTIGADRGGQLAMFDDFDIDYNQQKYLIETRISGALTKPKSAVVIKKTSASTVTPLAPEFDDETNMLDIPTITGVKYFDQETEAQLTGVVTLTKTTDVVARPDAGYAFPHGTDADWTYAVTP